LSQFKHTLKAYFSYRKKAVNAHGIHSPFVFNLYNHVLGKTLKNTKTNTDLERFLTSLKKDKKQLPPHSFGANSGQKKRTLSSVASKSIMPKNQRLRLLKLTTYLKSKTVLELGTSLGITSTELALHRCEVETIEADQNISNFAKQTFKKFKLEDTVKLHTQTFEEFFKTVSSEKKYDFIYLDGDHTEKATIENALKCEKHLNENGVLVLDDIYWSEGMTAAWEYLKNHSTFSYSIDLFRVGLLFKMPVRVKQHFVLK
jgi:predicted O-methyltransferase YrrM